MTSVRIPDVVWTWRSTALVVGVLLAPVLGLGLSTGGDLGATEGFDALILGPAALVSAIACYAAWCIYPRPGLAWATIGMAVLGCQEVARTSAQLVSGEPVTGLTVLEGDVYPALVVVVVVAVAHQVGRRPDPAAIGFGLGALVATLRLAGLDATAELPEHPQHWIVGIFYGAAVVCLAWVVSRGGDLAAPAEPMPPWARRRTAIAVVMIGAAHLTLYLGDTATTHALVVVGETVAAVLLVSTYLAHFLGEVETAQRSHEFLDDELENARRVDKAQRARLHEIHSTIVGITAASRLLRSMPQISEQRRIQMDDMVAAELGRLERMIALPDPSATRPTALDGDDTSDGRAIDLDATIGQVVVSHEARGRQVRWSPSRLRVRAHPDAVAAAFNVLLDNAAKHGRSAAEVTVARSDGYVEVAVHDDGPGVDPLLQARLFEWGARGPRSTGQGIGLHMARDLAEQQGGYLRWLDTTNGGATFVLGLPFDDVDSSEPEAPGGDGTSLQPDLA